MKQITIPFSIDSISNLMVYRLSDEGLWRLWNNVYNSGVLFLNGQGVETGHTGTADESPVKQGCKLISKKLTDCSIDNKPSLAQDQVQNQINIALTKVQYLEDKEKRRLLANKFNFSDLTLNMWSYMDWPHIIQTYRDLYVWLNDAPMRLIQQTQQIPVKYRWPLNRLDKTRIECLSMNPPKLMDVLKLTMCYIAAQVTLC